MGYRRTLFLYLFRVFVRIECSVCIESAQRVRYGPEQKKTAKIVIKSFTFPTSSGGSEKASKRTKERGKAWAKQTVWSKRMSKWCEQTSKQSSEWPSTSGPWLFWTIVGWQSSFCQMFISLIFSVTHAFLFCFYPDSPLACCHGDTRSRWRPVPLEKKINCGWL